MTYYLKITDPVSTKIFCVESRLGLNTRNKLNKENCMYDLKYIKNYLIHGDTYSKLKDELYANTPYALFKCELIPHSCFKKLFGNNNWLHFQHWPAL
jgi:hypothetical protein